MSTRENLLLWICRTTSAPLDFICLHRLHTSPRSAKLATELVFRSEFDYRLCPRHRSSSNDSPYDNSASASPKPSINLTVMRCGLTLTLIQRRTLHLYYNYTIQKRGECILFPIMSPMHPRRLSEYPIQWQSLTRPMS